MMRVIRRGLRKAEMRVMMIRVVIVANGRRRQQCRSVTSATTSGFRPEDQDYGECDEEEADGDRDDPRSDHDYLVRGKRIFQYGCCSGSYPIAKSYSSFAFLESEEGDWNDCNEEKVETDEFMYLGRKGSGEDVNVSDK